MMSDLFSERDPVRVALQLCSLRRFAERRDRFIDALDYPALDVSTRRAILDDDEKLAERILFGEIYAQHLDDMIALGRRLPPQIWQAA
jgi:hypothetical protein